MAARAGVVVVETHDRVVEQVASEIGELDCRLYDQDLCSKVEPTLPVKPCALRTPVN